MNNRLITVLVAAITIALAGLVLIQWRWVSGTIALKDAQLAGSIDAALVSVSERLERIEAVEGIRGHEQGRRILERVNGPQRDGGETAGEEVRITAPDGHVTILRRATDEPPPPPADSVMDAAIDDDAGMEGREALLSDIIEGLLEPSAMLPMVERIDPGLLDSLLQEELRARGVQLRAEHGVFDAKGHGVLVSLEHEADEPALAGSTHRVRLFPSDAVGEPFFLHVLIPGQDRLVWRSMWPMVGVSALLILLIIGGFIYSVRTIHHQKRLNDIRNDLVNNLTHELKTPISTIALACEALNDPGLARTPEQQRSFVAMIRDENKRLGVLVESVLQSAVLDSGNMRLRIVVLDMHAMLTEVVRNASIQAERRGGHLRLDLRAELAHLRGDRIHLSNVFYNLVDNAVKYCEETPEVRIATESGITGLTIKVSDNGIGIAPGEHRKIFDRLYRVPTGNLHNVKGFGLGLSYVRTVVAKHGGTIRVESEPGKGSTFIINLPFEHGEADPPAALRG
jgi:two-component system phosphate regulon sensor histidine kinase PhoR